MPVVRNIGVGNAYGQVFFEPAAVRLLHRSRPEQHKVILGKASHRQIAVEFALRRQHRRQRQPPGLGNKTGKDVVQVLANALTFEFVFSEVGDLYSTNGFTHSPNFLRDIVVRAVTLEGRNFICIFRSIRKPEHVFKAKTLIHHGTLGDHAIIERGRLLLTPLGKSFVREGHHEPAFVVFRRLDCAPVRCREFTKTCHVHRPDINRWFAVDHPLRKGQADTAALAEARHDTNSHPIIFHTRNRTN